MGLIEPESGTVNILGMERRTEKDFREVRANIGFVFQDADDQLFCPTVAEDVAFGPLNLGWPRHDVEQTVKTTLDMLGLSGFENRVTYKLSGGEKKLVSPGHRPGHETSNASFGRTHHRTGRIHHGPAGPYSDRL